MAARTAALLLGLLTSLAVPGFASGSSGHAVRATTDVRYREQLLQQTPISLRLFTATEIEERVLRRSDGIGHSTANLNFQTATGSSFDARIFIRGIGQADPNDLFEPAVGVFLDGVYLPRASTALFPLFDIERIEVLRGPQGALFGKNTVGGAIALRTVRPGREYGGKIELLYGNLGQLETRVSADIPVRLGAFRDKLFTRLSFASATNDGYVTHSPATFAAHRRQQNPMAYVGDLEGPDETTGDDKLLATRLAVQALPSDDLTIDFTFDWAREPKRQRIGACSRPDPFNAGGLVVESFGILGSDDCAISHELGPSLVGAVDKIGKTTRDTFGLNATITWDLPADLSLALITGWREQRSESRAGDLDGTPVPLITSVPSERRHDAVGGEIALRGSAFGALDFATGFVLLWERGRTTSRFDLTRSFTQIAESEFANRSYDWYGRASYTIADVVELTAGVRYSWERKERLGNITTLPPGVIIRPGETLGALQLRERARWTPLAELGWRATDDLFLYFHYARGWKSGGFNQTFVSQAEADSGLSEFEDENSHGFELGIKSDWLDGGLTANLAGFYTLYDDIQLPIIAVNELGMLGEAVRNATSARIAGFELELSGRAGPGWLPGRNAQVLFLAGVGFTHARYSSSFTQVAILPPVVPVMGTEVEFVDIDLAFRNTPRWNFNLSSTYLLDLPWKIGTFSLRLDYYYQTRVFFDVDNTLSQDAYGLLGGRIALHNDRWVDATFAFFAKNLLDERYIDGARSLGVGTGIDNVFWAPPRTYGFEIILRH